MTRSGGIRGMITRIVISMRRVVRCIWLVTLVLGACAPATLAGTDLGATNAPDFTLTDGLSGRAITLSAQRGQVVALTFLYTNCPVVCQLSWQRLRSAPPEVRAETVS